ncbi:hypothetical protein ACCO45_004531 [Purpureocillium lilacinum]|uniref:Uncharacterized protein n=1 Tax=Purpureocillium lilacinum TaxID=33203 RepID=A0ACC4E660_PURLI
MDTLAGAARKRLRRDTRSCYQCRKRKVKCELTEQAVETCGECIKSGTKCSIRPPDQDNLSDGGRAAHRGEHECASRLDRIETLLMKLVAAQDGHQLAAGSSSTSDSMVAAPRRHSPLPVGSAARFDNGSIPLSRRRPRRHDGPVPHPSRRKTSSFASLAFCAGCNVHRHKHHRLALGAENPSGTVLNADDTFRLLDTAALSRGSAMHIAKALLLFALYMQQLPVTFDTRFLRYRDIEKTVEAFVAQVKSFVLCDEDTACSIDGLECMTLIALVHLNNGAMRSAWMAFRRALDVARLIGLPSSFSLSARDSDSPDMALQLCFLDSEPGLGVDPFGGVDESWNDPIAGDEATIQRRISLVVAQIAQRNANGLARNRDALRNIDESLSKIQDSVPPSWWNCPSLPQERSLDSAQEPSRLICQLWLFQTRMYAHLPTAFGDITDDAIQSLERCMEACQAGLQQYLGLQHARAQLSRCRTIDQSAFTAAAVLILAKTVPRSKRVGAAAVTYDSDRTLLDQVIASLHAAGESWHNYHVARQASMILSAMVCQASSGVQGDVCASHTPVDCGANLTEQEVLDAEVHEKDRSHSISSGMDDIIVSSIQPLLGLKSPALCLIHKLYPLLGRKQPPSHQVWAE